MRDRMGRRVEVQFDWKTEQALSEFMILSKTFSYAKAVRFLTELGLKSFAGIVASRRIPLDMGEDSYLEEIQERKDKFCESVAAIPNGEAT